MNLRSYASAGMVIVAFGLMAAKCENKDVRFVLKYMPDHYRKCADAVVNIPDGPLTQKQLLELLVKLKKGYDGKDRCVDGAIAWSDAQVRAYNKHFGIGE